MKAVHIGVLYVLGRAGSDGGTRSILIRDGVFAVNACGSRFTWIARYECGFAASCCVRALVCCVISKLS